MRGFVLGAAVVGLASSCSGNFSGEIDGEGGPTFMTALVAETELGEGDETATATVVMGFSFQTSCEQMASYQERRQEIMKDFSEAEDPDEVVDDTVADLEANDKEHGWPETGWLASILVLSEDPLEDDTDFDAFGEEDALVGVSINHQTEAIDYEELLTDGEDKSTDSYTAIDGKITFVTVNDKSLTLETDELDLAEADDVSEDGDDADVAGSGVLKLSAQFCGPLSELLKDSFTISIDVDPPAGECTVGSDCPNIACLCDDGSALGTPVNTQRCVNESCQEAQAACPDSCGDFGFTWTGSVVEGGEEPPPPPPPPPTGGEESDNCGSFLGAGDGCDCGCGTFDSDCSSLSDTCDFNNCVSGSPDPNFNSDCI